MKNCSPFKIHFLVTFTLLGLCGCNRNVPTGPLAQSDQVAEIRAGLKSSGGGGPKGPKIDWKTTFVTLKGSVVFDGNAPSDNTLRVTRDGPTCGPSGSVSAGSIKIGANGGIANVLIFVQTSDPSMPIADSAKPSTDEKRTLLDQKKCVFLPHMLAFPVGTTIDIQNSDPVGHNTALKFSRGQSTDQLLPGGAKTTFKPTKFEKSPTKATCAIHPWMASYVFVHENGYFAVTDANGNFELRDLPTNGPLTVKIWHERVKGKGGFFKKANITGSWANKAKPTNNGFKLTLKEEDKDCKNTDFVIKADSAIIK